MLLLDAKCHADSDVPIFFRIAQKDYPIVKNFIDDSFNTEGRRSSYPKNSYLALVNNFPYSLQYFRPPDEKIFDLFSWFSMYNEKWKHFKPSRNQPPQSIRQIKKLQQSTPISSRVYARVGLLGNPSDGFYGKTLSLLIKNFSALVVLTPNENEEDESVKFQANNILDPIHYPGISSLSQIVSKDGYQGAIILFLALIKVFTDYCIYNNIPLKPRGFTIKYSTTIPRQVGLAGSSALIIALLKALIDFYEISCIPLPMQANIALKAEHEELNISAGHQDRVVQTFGGLVYMDFDKRLMETRGYGEYLKIQEKVDLSGLFLAYVAQPKNSGKAHSNIRSKYDQGDNEIRSAMNSFASLALMGKECLLKNDKLQFTYLMDKNFELRNKVYGDVIGGASWKLISIAQSFNFAAKFSGSGGAVIGMFKGKEEDEKIALRDLKREYQRQGFVFCMIEPHY